MRIGQTATFTGLALLYAALPVYAAPTTASTPSGITVHVAGGPAVTLPPGWTPPAPRQTVTRKALALKSLALSNDNPFQPSVTATGACSGAEFPPDPIIVPAKGGTINLTYTGPYGIGYGSCLENGTIYFQTALPNFTFNTFSGFGSECDHNVWPQTCSTTYTLKVGPNSLPQNLYGELIFASTEVDPARSQLPDHATYQQFIPLTQLGSGFDLSVNDPIQIAQAGAKIGLDGILQLNPSQPATANITVAGTNVDASDTRTTTLQLQGTSQDTGETLIWVYRDCLGKPGARLDTGAGNIYDGIRRGRNLDHDRYRRSISVVTRGGLQ